MKKMVMIMIIALVAMVSAFAYEVEIFHFGEDTFVITEGSECVIGEFKLADEMESVDSFEGSIEDAITYEFEIGWDYTMNLEGTEDVYQMTISDNHLSKGYSFGVTVMTTNYSEFCEVMTLIAENM